MILKELRLVAHRLHHTALNMAGRLSSVNSPPTRDSDLPVTLPWQPVLGSSLLGVPPYHLYGSAAERQWPTPTTFFAFIKK